MSYLTNFRHEDAGALLGIFKGSTCFLVCGGPSTRSQDLELLQRRGILVAAVNNVAAGIVRPQVWFSTDTASNFSASIWDDPAIMKFCREDRLQFRTSKFDPGTGRFDADGELVRDCPNVWGFKVRDVWAPESFLTSQLPTCGADDALADPEGRGMNKSVLLVALRILYDLGIRRLYLLGADFRMDPADPYSFPEQVDASRLEQNRHLFGWLDRRLAEAKPHCDRAKFKIWNCSPGSALTAFPAADYADAVKREGARVDQNPVTRGQYQK